MRAGAASARMPRKRDPPDSILRGVTGKGCAFAQNGRQRAQCIRRVHTRFQAWWTPECLPSASSAGPGRSGGDSAGNTDNGW